METILKEGIDVYEIDGAFSFGMANKFDTTLGLIGNKPKVRIIRMRHVPFMDSTGLHNLEILLKSCKKEGIHVLLSGVNESVYKTISQSGLLSLIGEDNIYSNIHEAIARAELLVASYGSDKTE